MQLLKKLAIIKTDNDHSRAPKYLKQIDKNVNKRYRSNRKRNRRTISKEDTSSTSVEDEKEQQKSKMSKKIHLSNNESSKPNTKNTLKTNDEKSNLHNDFYTRKHIFDDEIVVNENNRVQSNFIGTYNKIFDIENEKSNNDGNKDNLNCNTDILRFNMLCDKIRNDGSNIDLHIFSQSKLDNLLIDEGYFDKSLEHILHEKSSNYTMPLKHITSLCNTNNIPKSILNFHNSENPCNLDNVNQKLTNTNPFYNHDDSVYNDSLISNNVTFHSHISNAIRNPFHRSYRIADTKSIKNENYFENTLFFENSVCDSTDQSHNDSWIFNEVFDNKFNEQLEIFEKSFSIKSKNNAK